MCPQSLNDTSRHCVSSPSRHSVPTYSKTCLFFGAHNISVASFLSANSVSGLSGSRLFVWPLLGRAFQAFTEGLVKLLEVLFVHSRPLDLLLLGLAHLLSKDELKGYSSSESTHTSGVLFSKLKLQATSPCLDPPVQRKMLFSLKQACSTRLS